MGSSIIGPMLEDETTRATKTPTRRGAKIPLPDALEPRPPEPGRFAYVILGAGCAGLSLCHYLLERGVDDPILVIDRKEAFADDRTWCFWDVEETPFSHLAARRWSAWEVCAAGRKVVHTSERYPYLCLTGADFYRAVLGGISDHPNVTVRLGEDVRGHKEFDDGVRVATAGRTYVAGEVSRRIRRVFKRSGAEGAGSRSSSWASACAPTNRSLTRTRARSWTSPWTRDGGYASPTCCRSTNATPWLRTCTSPKKGLRPACTGPRSRATCATATASRQTTTPSTARSRATYR